MLKEARREACIRAEQQRVFAAYDACVEVRNRHRRRTGGRLAINLGMMAMAYGVDVAAQPDAADGESAIAFAFGDLRLQQQRHGAAARSNEHEFGRHGCETSVKDVLDGDAPAPVVLAVEANNLPIIVNVEAGLI